MYLRVIEGATRDAMSFRGIATDFERTKPLNFHLKGTFVDLFEELPFSPYDLSTTLEYTDFEDSEVASSTGSIGILDMRAQVIYTRTATERSKGLDPDGALISFTSMGASVLFPGNETLTAFLSSIRRGWCPISTVAVVGIVCFTTAWIIHDTKGESRTLSGKVEVGANVSVQPGPATPQR